MLLLEKEDVESENLGRGQREKTKKQLTSDEESDVSTKIHFLLNVLAYVT